MASSKDILRYLRECYRENGSRGGIWNFFGNSVQNRVFLKERDLLADNPDGEGSHYLRNKRAGVAAEQAFAYRKERDLVYATVFLTGWIERFEGRPEAVCAPVFTFPAKLETEGLEIGARLEIDPAGRQINYAVLEAIGGEELVDAIEKAIEPNALTEGCIGQVRTLVDGFFPESDCDALLRYPHLVSEPELRELFKTVEKRGGLSLTLCPAAAVALVKKSTQMRGVLNELEEMAENGSALSAPLRSLLEGEKVHGKPEPPGRVPAILSAAQQAILESARSHSLTLAIGPPGTGKSFTIASLAIETLSRGGSVLIASKMDHAVDVVGDKIEKSIGLEGVVVRGGRREYLKDLKRFVGELLDGLHTADAPDDRSVRAGERALRKQERQIERLRNDLAARLEAENRKGDLLSRTGDNWFLRLRRNWVKRSAGNRIPVWEIASRLEGLIDRQLVETVDYLGRARANRLARHLQGGTRLVFQNFLKAIRARTGSRQESFFEKIPLSDLFGALPIWLVNLSDVHRVLPMKSECFDLAIIDEATQCDIASAMPVIQRARRAVITGDPKQLRHLSFLPHARQRAIADQFGLSASEREQFNFRDVSLLDLVSDRIHDQRQVAFLNEHFRSRPEIISFSNRRFYADRLHIMTGLQSSGRGPLAALESHRIEGAREASGINRAEADWVCDIVRAVGVDQAALSKKAVHSIGVLSPFRDQVDHLLDRLIRDPGGRELMHRHDILVGTAHTFQGEERDLMFLSLAVDDVSPAASFRFLEKPDVFNVAVTRARLLNAVAYSFDPASLKADSLLADYLRHLDGAADGKPEGSQADAGRKTHDQFASDVANFLTSSGAVVTAGYPLAGMEVDLVYTLDEETVGIDLIGYPGAYSDAFPLERILTFRRAGLRILPLPYAAWLCCRERCEAWLIG